MQGLSGLYAKAMAFKLDVYRGHGSVVVTSVLIAFLNEQSVDLVGAVPITSNDSQETKNQSGTRVVIREGEIHEFQPNGKRFRRKIVLTSRSSKI